MLALLLAPAVESPEGEWRIVPDRRPGQPIPPLAGECSGAGGIVEPGDLWAATRDGRVRLTPAALADEIADAPALEPAYVSEELLGPLARWLRTGADGRLVWKGRTLESEVGK